MAGTYNVGTYGAGTYGGVGDAIQVQIGGSTVTVQAGTLTMTSTIGRRSTAGMLVYGPTSTHFVQNQQVQVFDATSTLIFSGYIDQPQEVQPGFQPFLETVITCKDQHYLADKRILAIEYRNKTCGFMVQDIITNILAAEGVTVGMIAVGATVPIANFGYCTVAEALDALVGAASASGVPYYWMIDQNKALWFVPYTAIAGPAVDGTQIDDGTASGFKPTVTRANPKYRNTQYAVGGVSQTSVQTEIQVGDGSKQSFTMGFALSLAPTISVNLNGAGYVSQTVGKKGQTGFQWYWAQGDPVITQDSSGTKLRGPSAPIDLLKVVYTGQLPTVFTAVSAAQVAAQAALDGTSGIVESVLTDNSIASAADGQAKVNQQLAQFGMAGTLFQFATRSPIFAAGQLCSFTYGPYNFIATPMLISEVDASDQQDHFNLWYKISAVQGPYDVSWVDFFNNLLSPATIANSINLGVSLNTPLYPSTTLKPSTTLFPS